MNTRHIPVLAPGWKVLVRLQKEEVSSGGIVLATRKGEDLEKGVVVHMGPSCFEKVDPNNRWYEVGDTVYLRKYEGKYIHKDGVDYRMIDDDDVWGVENKEYIPQEEAREVRK